MSSMARLVSLTILTTLIIFLAITFYQVIAPFLLPLFLAGVIAILCQPILSYFLWRTNDHPRIAAGLTTASILAIVLVPFLVGVFLASVQLITLAQNTVGNAQWQQHARKIRAELEIDHLVERIQPFIPSDQDPDQLQAEIEETLQHSVDGIVVRTLGFAGAAAGSVPQAAIGFLGTMVSGLIAVVMFVIALYYFLADGPAMITTSETLIPVHIEYQRQLLRQFEKVVRAVVMATFLAAIGQGLATAIALYFAGFEHFFVNLIVSTLAALVPLAGTWLVWGPCAIWLAYQGYWWSAILLTLFGAIVVGMLDNVIRTYVLNSDAKLHPLLAFVSVLGGLQVMGLWGVFIGPIVASCLHALIQIFNTELKEFSKAKFGSPDEEKSNSVVSPVKQVASTSNVNETPLSQTKQSKVTKVQSKSAEDIVTKSEQVESKELSQESSLNESSAKKNGGSV